MTGIEAFFAGRMGDFDLDVAFTAPGRGVTALFGPSGCGKTTVLRCLAGLTRLEGRLAVEGEAWQDEARFLPPHRRPVGYVFQEASLFPHLSVRGNLLYGHRRAGGAQGLSFDETVSLLGLEGLLDRAPERLSGGERQRVAIGRALLSEPRLLLMDEPLAALDAASKNDILPYLETLHETLSIPVVYVSHDLAEVERLADTMILMEAGRVRAAGPVADLASDVGLPLATARDAAAVLEAEVADYDAAYALTRLKVPGGSLIVPGRLGEAGRRRRLRIAAQDVGLALEPPQGTSIVNILPARIIESRPTGEAQVTLVVGLGPEGTGARLLSRITRKSWDSLGLSLGKSLHVQIKGVALVERARD